MRASLLFTLIAPIANALLQAQTTSTPPHPNHYVVLLDASGSALTPPQRRKAYASVLATDLAARLYRTGFGSRIPPISATDRLTALRFGIVEQGRGEAYRQLGQHDFVADFLHPVLWHRSGTTEQDFVNDTRVLGTSYRITALGWSKELGLWKAAVPRGDTVERTFLIVLHDGIPNDESVRAEINLLRNWGEPTSVSRAQRLVDAVGAAYLFTDANGRQAPALTVRVGPSTSPFFLEAFEVVSAHRLAWEDSLSAIATRAVVARAGLFRWGTQPALRLTVDSTVVAMLSETESSLGGMQATVGDVVWAAPASVSSLSHTIVVPLNGPSCGRITGQSRLAIAVTQQDSILGTRHSVATLSIPNASITSLRCAVTRVATLTGIAVVVSVAVLAALWYVTYRWRTTAMALELPALGVSLRVPRCGRMVHSVPAEPGLDQVAAVFRLPSKAVTHLTLSSARLGIGPAAQRFIAWRDGTRGDVSRSLPRDVRRLELKWTRPPDDSCAVELTFAHGSHQSTIELHYPRVKSWDLE